MDVLRLKEVMGIKGMSGKELALAVDVTPVTISSIVQGNSFPKPDLLLAIAKTLDVDIRELFKPTKTGSIGNLNGFIEHEGIIYRINTVKDLGELMEKVRV